MGYFILDQIHNIPTPNSDLPAVLSSDERLLGTEVVRVGVKSLEQRELTPNFTSKSPNSPFSPQNLPRPPCLRLSVPEKTEGWNFQSVVADTQGATSLPLLYITSCQNVTSSRGFLEEKNDRKEPWCTMLGLHCLRECGADVISRIEEVFLSPERGLDATVFFSFAA